MRTLEAELLSKFDEGGGYGAVGEVVGGRSLEHPYLIVALCYRPVVPVLPSQVALEVALV